MSNVFPLQLVTPQAATPPSAVPALEGSSTGAGTTRQPGTPDKRPKQKMQGN